MSLDSGLVQAQDTAAMQAITILGDSLTLVPGVGVATCAAKAAVAHRQID